MRLNFLHRQKPGDEDELHSVPIQDMGNYHEYLKNQTQPLRELETQMVRQHMFGNPFKLVSKEQKSSIFGTDEIDEVIEESAENSNNNQLQQSQNSQPQQQQQQQQQGSNRRSGTKRKGALSKDINYLKNFYNNNSSSSSVIMSDSESEVTDDLSSVSQVILHPSNSNLLV
jgi:type VI protein secretion system component VasK